MQGTNANVRLVSEEVISIKKMDPMSGFDTRLVFTLPPRDSTQCSTKDVYTSEITFLALYPWVKC